MHKLQLAHPFRTLMYGGTITEKTIFVKYLFENAQVMIEPTHKNDKIHLLKCFVAGTLLKHI